VTVGPDGGSVFTVAEGAGSAFDAATAASGFSGRRAGAGATGEGGGGAAGPFPGAVSVARAAAPRFGEAFEGMIGRGMVARGCATRGSG
jgi:hypothetical protein